MPLVAANVEVALTGAAYFAALGSALPTDSVTAWPAAYTDLGYIDANGVTQSPTDTTTDIVAWQNHLLVRRIISKSETTFKFHLLETKKSTKELYNKSSAITGAPGAYVLTVKNPGTDIRVFGFDVIDGAKHTRIVVPTAEVTARGPITYKADAAIGYDVTISSYPDSVGTIAYEYSADAAWGMS